MVKLMGGVALNTFTAPTKLMSTKDKLQLVQAELFTATATMLDNNCPAVGLGGLFPIDVLVDGGHKDKSITAATANIDDELLLLSPMFRLMFGTPDRPPAC